MQTYLQHTTICVSKIYNTYVYTYTNINMCTAEGSVCVSV